MGLGITELELLLHEHRYRPITGSVITLGRQAVIIPTTLLSELLSAYGIKPAGENGFEFEFDPGNQHTVGTIPVISDRSLFAALSDCKLFSLDISSYEGADYVWDICGESPTHLYGQFEFVIEGGSLDNVFDPVRAMRNMCDMLRPGGRIFVFTWGNSFPTSYLKFSPDWLMDYFAVNEWADCKVYAIQFVRDNGRGLISAWNYNPLDIQEGQIRYQRSHITTFWPREIICIAERGPASTTHRIPVQERYRGARTEPYNTSAARFNASPRPLFTSPVAIPGSPNDRISPYATMQRVSTWPPVNWTVA